MSEEEAKKYQSEYKNNVYRPIQIHPDDNAFFLDWVGLDPLHLIKLGLYFNAPGASNEVNILFSRCDAGCSDSTGDPL